MAASRSGYLVMRAKYSEHELLIGGQQVMQDWERPLMLDLAKEAARNGGHVLEVGFGMGISASYLIQEGCSKYTVIEPHKRVLKEFQQWASQQPVPVEAVEGFWEDVIDNLGLFDGILFDIFPTTATEYSDRYTLPFIPKASEHLKPGGVFTYYSGCPEKVPDKSMELLRSCFSRVDFHHVTGLNPPKDCQYYSESKMVVPVCIK